MNTPRQQMIAAKLQSLHDTLSELESELTDNDFKWAERSLLHDPDWVVNQVAKDLVCLADDLRSSAEMFSIEVSR